MGEYVEVDLPEKIKLLLVTNGIDPEALVERAVNRLMGNVELTTNDRRRQDRRTNLRLVNGRKAP